MSERIRAGTIVAGVVAIGLALGVARAEAQRPEADSVRAAERARREAVLAADTAALGRLVAPEFLEITRFGTLRTRAENLADIATGTLRLATLEHDSLDIRIYGDLALLTGVARQTGTFRGTPFAGRVRYLRVFVRRDGRWQAVAMQHTALP